MSEVIVLAPLQVPPETEHLSALVYVDLHANRLESLDGCPARPPPPARVSARRRAAVRGSGAA